MGLAAILGLILPAIPGIIGTIEKLFGKKTSTTPTPDPVTGQSKFDAVFAQIMSLVNGLIAAGKIPHGTVISDDSIKGAIESIVQLLNAQGLLKGDQTNIDAIIKAVEGLFGQGTTVTPTPATGGLVPAGTILRVMVIA
jgi:hypothetical protein